MRNRLVAPITSQLVTRLPNEFRVKWKKIQLAKRPDWILTGGVFGKNSQITGKYNGCFYSWFLWKILISKNEKTILDEK